MTGEQPLVCVVDDGQWLGQASGQTPGFAARRLTAEPVGPMFGAREPGAELAGLRELAVAELGERHARASPDLALAGPLDARVRDQSESIPQAGILCCQNVYVSALTYCTTMTTCPSGLSVTVYQMVKPWEGR